MTTTQIDRRTIKTYCPRCYRSIRQRVTVMADGTANVQCLEKCNRWFQVRVFNMADCFRSLTSLPVRGARIETESNE